MLENIVHIFPNKFSKASLRRHQDQHFLKTSIYPLDIAFDLYFN